MDRIPGHRVLIGVLASVMLLVLGSVPAGVDAANVGGNTPVFGGALYSNPITANGSYIPIVTSCGGVVDVLWYGPGSAPDARWLDVDATSHTDVPVNIAGWYKPLVGDFDGDGCEDIFWYGPEALPDHVWYVNPDRSIDSRAVVVSGDYRPIVGNFDPAQDPLDEIYWYGPGSTTETIWAHAGSRGRFDSLLAPQVNGTYVPLSFDSALVVWYAAGTAQDYVTAPTAGSSTPWGNWATSINGTYEPFTFGDAVVFYSPGPGLDYLLQKVNFLSADRAELRTDTGSINGTYRPAVAGDRPFTVLHAPGPDQDYLLTQLPL
jgi:hypothetical protein